MLADAHFRYLIRGIRCSADGPRILERTTISPSPSINRCNVILKVFLSLASSHNAVYRMLSGLRPLLEEFQVQSFHTFTSLPNSVWFGRVCR